MTRLLFLLLIISGAWLLQSCYYDNEEDLYGESEDCGLIDQSYATDIVPIMERHCYECHDARNQQGGINLEGHANLIVYIDNNRLLGSIKHEAGYSPMPLNTPKMDVCRIEAIGTWINEGAANN